MASYFSENVTVLYQRHFDPAGIWMVGDVGDFAEDVGLEYTADDGMGGDNVFIVPEPEIRVTYELGDPLPAELREVEGKPVMFYTSDEGLWFEVYNPNQKIDDEE